MGRLNMRGYSGLYYPGCVLYAKEEYGAEPSSLIDNSGYSNNGTYTDITDTQLSSGLWTWTFNGSSSLITIADDTSFDITTALTFIAWASTDNYTTVNQTVGAKYETDLREWRLTLSTTGNLGKPLVFFGDPADGSFEGSWISDNQVITDSAWHQVGFTFSSGTVVIYVDGVAVAGSVSSGSIPSTLNNETADVKIGESQSQWFDGKIALPRIYNYVLTSSEITALYNSQSSLFA